MNTGSYMNGKWFHPKSNRLVRNLNPADTDDVIAEFPAATAEDVQSAIECAQAAARGWRKTPGPERGRVLWRAADIARQRADEIARTLTREEGKVLKEAKGEVMKGISLLEFYAGEGFRMHGKTLPSEARDTFTYTVRSPLGVVGLIAPWNFPWAIPVWKSAPALAAGNCVIFKPAELTPATATLLTEIYQEAGLPPGVFNMVVGSGSVVVEAAKKIKIGSGLDESVDMGPAVDEKQWKTDLDYINIGRQEGARLVLGGNKPDHPDKGYFVEPTIFDNVEPGMRIFKEEIFGPVLAVSTAKTIDEALAFANGVEYGLTTSIFTENIDTIMRFVEEVETGMVHVNEPTIGGEAQLPFGGTKATGVGEREMAEEGLNFFTELKTVFINYSGKAERLMIR